MNHKSRLSLVSANTHQIHSGGDNTVWGVLFWKNNRFCDAEQRKWTEMGSFSDNVTSQSDYTSMTICQIYFVHLYYENSIKKKKKRVNAE